MYKEHKQFKVLLRTIPKRSQGLERTVICHFRYLRFDMTIIKTVIVEEIYCVANRYGILRLFMATANMPVKRFECAFHLVMV